MSEYAAALTSTMEWLAEDPRTVFLGQAVGAPGTAMSGTLSGIDPERRLEMPVTEELQMGMSLGLALQGWVPISIFPRWNFLILAANQLVNHIDKMPLLSGFRPKVLIRVGVGSEHPLDPGPQHIGDFTDGFRALLKTVHVARILSPADVRTAYQDAMAREGSTVLVEMSDLYNG